MSFFLSRPKAVAALLFAAIFLLRATVGSVGDAISFLYVIPVVVIATAIGARAGLIAGTVAFVLSSLGSIVVDLPVSPLGYVNRALVYLFIGGLVGRFADRLRALEAESARHFNLSLDMISTAGFDGCFKSVNPAFERILGYREEDLVGRPFLEFVHPDDLEKTEREAAGLSDGKTTVQFQNRYFDRKGEVHWLEWASVPLPDEHIIYGVARDITERKAMEEELERLSRQDSLTGLLNRRSFDEALERQLAYTRRYGSGGALLIVDLDRFKQINDEFGHPAGDRVLCQVARVLGENLRSTDTVGRYSDGVVARLGGDEFALLLPEADAVGAEAVAERLVAALAAAPLEVEGGEIWLAISVGVALFDENGLPPAEDLLAAADRAMYVAKAAGGGGSVLAGADA
ncbi:MAG TPA: diguanylate cyclase [Solirubrobacterales bacterium]|nr:diguanylate cyclase [Solirubrobacterales bacterium]